MVTLPVERYVYIPYVLCWLYLPDTVLAAYEMITVEVGLPIFSPSGSNPVHTLMGLLQLEVWKIDKGSEQLVQPTTQPTGVHTCSWLLMPAHACSWLLMPAHGCSWLLMAVVHWVPNYWRPSPVLSTCLHTVFDLQSIQREVLPS